MNEDFNKKASEEEKADIEQKNNIDILPDDMIEGVEGGYNGGCTCSNSGCSC